MNLWEVYLQLHWASLQQIRWLSLLFSAVCAVSTCIEYGSQIMAAEEERRMGNGAGGLHSSSSPQFSQNVEKVQLKNNNSNYIEATQWMSTTSDQNLLVTWTTCWNYAIKKKKKLLISESLFVVILSFNQNRFSGLSYSLNSASFKAENSLNWLVFFSVSIIL